MFKTMFKTTLKKFDVAIAEGDKAAAEVAYRNAVSVLDKAACKGVIHTNAAARIKSRYTHKLNTL
jgi:small subunit ribosomal protein S20